VLHGLLAYGKDFFAGSVRLEQRVVNVGGNPGHSHPFDGMFWSSHLCIEALPPHGSRRVARDGGEGTLLQTAEGSTSGQPKGLLGRLQRPTRGEILE
jgi:hypothetical protein